MRNILLWIWVFCNIQNGLLAADNLRFSDIRSIGMGGNESTQSRLFNPSLLARSNKKVIQLNYFNRYLLNELPTVNCNLYYPNSVLPLGLNVTSFGYDAYRESMFRVALAKELSNKISVGVSFQYHILQTALYPETPSQLSTDIGLLYSLIDKLTIGVLILNLPSVCIGREKSAVKNYANYLFQIGFQYQIINHVLLTGNIENNTEQVMTGSMGLEYNPFDTFKIRAGLTRKPFYPSFGIGYSISKLTIDIASIYHPILGMSTGLGLQFSF